MPVGFRRQFRLLERLFPPSGISHQDFPRAVDETVVPSWDVFRNLPGEFRFRTLNDITVAALGNNVISLGGPTSGYMWVPLTLSTRHDDVAGTKTTQFALSLNVAIPQDPWGVWAPFTLQEITSGTNEVGDGWARPLFPFVPARNTIEVAYLSMTAGTTLATSLCVVEGPAELIDVTRR